jgi:CheY-like chemotaxis protein/HPt (histidine-containing phosphotransfer) domain-containing protein
MPGMDGFRVVQTINGMSLTYQPQMVMLTSSDAIEEKARARELNIASYIVKPFRRIELLEGILVALGKKDKSAEHKQPARKLEEITLPPLKILLAEDIETNQKVIKLYLKDSPVAIDIAENGKIAVDKYTRNQYDVVLMDIEMPEMDGLSATKAIRKWEQEHRRHKTPVIALTAHAFGEQMNECFAAGCTAFLSKPLKKAELLKTLKEISEEKPGDEGGMPSVKLNKEDAEELTDTDDTHEDPSVQTKYHARVKTDLKELVPSLFDEINQEMPSMQNALEANDFATLKRFGHGFKGTAATLGLDELSKIFYEIENAAKNNKKATIINSIERIKGYIIGVEIEYI